MAVMTGGMGYIGIHAVIQLIESGNEVIILDNLSNSNEVVLKRIETITRVIVKFYKENLLNIENVEHVFWKNKIDSVIHFATLKAVGESVAKPLEYYNSNLIGSLNLLKVMKKHNLNKFVFSSSATVSGNPERNPIIEDLPYPYDATKLMVEGVLRYVCKTDSTFNIGILRYFNPVGTHISGTIDEEPNGIPNNLMPYITKAAVGSLEYLNLFGNDYEIPDGTGVRNYIHVDNLALGHLKVLEKLNTTCGLVTYNFGVGKGYSVLDLVKNFAEISGKEIPYKIIERRARDIGMCYADFSKVNLS